MLAHVVLRVWASPNIGTDEVDQALAAQAWSWGYEPRNPPLYTWLMMAFYAVLGPTTWAHIVLKYVLLTALYAFAYLCGRRLFATPGHAALSALALVLM